MDLIELDTKASTKLTLRASDIRGIESKPYGCDVQWLIGDVMAKIECATPYTTACGLWWGGS